MDSIRRGTTPVIRCILDIGQANISVLWLTFSQDEEEKFTKTLSDISWEGRSFRVRLTQEDTLKFKADELADVQLRLLLIDGTAMGSNTVPFLVTKVRKDGVIE